MRFDNAKIEDSTYCMVYGHGKIMKIYIDLIEVEIFNHKVVKTMSYTKCGRFYKHECAEPILFYCDETSNFLTERPLPKIDLTKLPVDTKLVVGSHHSAKRYFSNFKNNLIYCYDDGCTSWSGKSHTNCVDNKCITNWKYAELGEDVTIDDITYPKGLVILDEP